MGHTSGATSKDVTIGIDGVARCAWAASDPLSVAYHDEEWGRPVRDEGRLFEMLILEGFQAGLSWVTILHKRDAFRAAFAGFDTARVASFGEADLERLMGDAGIVRNRAKIVAARGNARSAQSLRADGSSLSELVWSFAPAPRARRPASLTEVPAETPESRALASDLKHRGFRFVGPTIVYAFMQAIGMVDDHLVGCDLPRP
ncbi:MAG: DNA-3-methyladenine glycosylase I [Actinomycetota bacterium]